MGGGYDLSQCKGALKGTMDRCEFTDKSLALSKYRNCIIKVNNKNQRKSDKEPMQFFHIFALHITPAQTNANKIMQVNTAALPISFAFAARGCFSTVTRTAGKSIDASKTPDVAFPRIIFIIDIIHYP